ncbi:MAG: hypothetical protein HYR73_07160 [Candidatus Eisenbacteria bacterium]|nr:hypothetical protein [Candidatus Eisenbacteria bacterium]
MAGLAYGCSRTAHVPSANPDSLHAVAPDSNAIQARDVQARWESGVAPDEAARATASLLLSDLSRRLPPEWESRSHSLLDSLAVGAEIASVRCLLAVNLFARSNPEAGSWPWLYWCGPKRPRSQAIEGRGLHLLSIAAPPHDTGSWCAVLFSHRAGGGQEPLVMV